MVGASNWISSKFTFGLIASKKDEKGGVKNLVCLVVFGT